MVFSQEVTTQYSGTKPWAKYILGATPRVGGKPPKRLHFEAQTPRAFFCKLGSSVHHIRLT